MTQVYEHPDNIYTNQAQWWFAYDVSNNTITITPLQSCGYISGRLALVIADTKEELDQYIVDNGLYFPPIPEPVLPPFP
jgi:hypothetical protein